MKFRIIFLVGMVLQVFCQRPSKSHECKKPLPPCKSGQYPTKGQHWFSHARCCAKVYCKQPKSWYATLKPCPAGEHPKLDATGCPTCLKKVCKLAHSSIPECDIGKYPSIDPTSHCPTCRISKCSRDQAIACAAHRFESSKGTKYKCTDEKGPEFVALSCCMTCHVPKCAKDPKDIPTCAKGERPETVFSTGCYSCKLSVTTCPDTWLRKVPFCHWGQKPMMKQVGTHACPTCKPQICPKKKGEIPQCDVGMKPKFSLFNHCPSCIPPMCTAAKKALVPQCVHNPPTKDLSTGCLTCHLPKCTLKIKNCTTGDKPTIDYSTGCYSCHYPKFCKKHFWDIPHCTKDKKPIREADGCWSCRTLIPSCLLKPSSVVACKTDEKPTKLANGCPSCHVKPPLCRLLPHDIPVCDGVLYKKGVINHLTGCMVCRPEITEKCPPVRTCYPKEVVKMTNNCPHCRPIKVDSCGGFSGMMKQKMCYMKAKLAGGLRECGVDEKPERNPSTCCLNCYIPSKKRCTKEAYEKCRSKNINPCKDWKEFARAFNPSTCCFLCSAPRPHWVTEEKRSNWTEVLNILRNCTHAQFQGALKEAPECSSDEHPEWVVGNCGPSCKRPQRRCTKLQIAKCWMRTPECLKDQRPVVVKDECCESCRPAKPLCTPKCDSKHVCTTKGCLPHRIRNYTLSFATKEMCDEIHAMPQNGTLKLITEVVERFCEKAKNRHRCEHSKVVVTTSMWLSHRVIHEKCGVNGGKLNISLVMAAIGGDDDLVSVSLNDTDASHGIHHIPKCRVSKYITKVCWMLAKKKKLKLPACGVNKHPSRHNVNGHFVCCPCIPDCKGKKRVCKFGEQPNYKESCPCVHKDSVPKCTLSKSELHNLKFCALGHKPVISITTGCPDCKPHICHLPPRAIPPCNKGQHPAKDPKTHCPTCRPVGVFCTKKKAMQCAKEKKVNCAKTQAPKWDRIACCLSCYVPPCDKYALMRIPSCQAHVKPTFDFSTGCPSCRRVRCPLKYVHMIPKCKVGQKPYLKPNGCWSCDRGYCKKKISEIEPCAPGETPVVNPSNHCPSCSRPVCKTRMKIPFCVNEWPKLNYRTGCPSCILKKCTKHVKPCGSGEKPTFNFESGCHSCSIAYCKKPVEEIPVCAAGVHSKLQPDGCYSCRRGKLPCELHPSKIAMCNEGQEPKMLNGCPSCRKHIPHCHRRPSAIPYCESEVDEQNALDEETGCLKCKKHHKKCPPVRLCKHDQHVKHDAHGCPDCHRPHSCDGHHGAAAKKKCHKLAHGSGSGTRECKEWEIPKRHPGSCCLSCIPKRKHCGHKEMMMCKKKQVPVCSSMEEHKHAFNPRTCCMLCSRPPTNTSDKPVDGKCTKAQFLKAMKEAPSCGPGQTPKFDKKQWCGPSCTRVHRRCKKQQVAHCRRHQRICAVGENRTRVHGECCYSCRHPRPSCKCSKGQVCARRTDENGTVVGTHCHHVKKKRFHMKIPDKDVHGEVKKMDKETLKHLLITIFDRYCDRTEFHDKCNKVVHSVKDTLNVTSMKNVTDGIEYTVEGNSTEIDSALMDGLAAEGMLSKQISMPIKPSGAPTHSEPSNAPRNLCSLFFISSFILLKVFLS